MVTAQSHSLYAAAQSEQVREREYCAVEVVLQGLRDRKRRATEAQPRTARQAFVRRPLRPHVKDEHDRPIVAIHRVVAVGLPRVDGDGGSGVERDRLTRDRDARRPAANVKG